MANLAQIYDWFMTGKKPTQAQFWASWGSFYNKEESIPQSAVSNLTTVLNAKTENDQFNAHKTDVAAHADLFNAKEDKNQKGVAGGYAPLNEFQRIASQYLAIVDDLVTGGSDSLLSGEQGKVLKSQIDAINLLLTSDDVNLDTVQELVDAIKTVETSLETILVNDLTTGGVTKALTAEMGKQLDLLKENTSNKSQDIEADKASTTKYGSVKAVYDWAGKFKTYLLGIETMSGISYTLNLPNINKRTVFTGNNPVVLTVPTNATVEIPIGTQKEFTVQGTGTATVSGVGITFVQKNLIFTTGDTFHLTKIDTDLWTVEGGGGGDSGADLLHKTGNETKIGTLSLITPNVSSGTSNLNALKPIVITGGKGGDNNSPSGFAVGGNSGEIVIKTGNGGNSVTSSDSTNIGGNAGQVYLVAGDGGLAVNGTTNFPGNAGKVMLQGGDSYGGIAGAAYLKAGNNRGVNSLGGSVYIVPGYGDANIDLNGNPIYHGAVFLNSLEGSNVRGNTVIGGTIDDKTHRLQVVGKAKIFGTLKADPASEDTELVTLGQAKALASSGSFTPDPTSAIFNTCYWQRVGNLVTVTYNFSYVLASAIGGAVIGVVYPSGHNDASPSAGQIRGSGSIGASGATRTAIMISSDSSTQASINIAALPSGTYSGNVVITYVAQ